LDSEITALVEPEGAPALFLQFEADSTFTLDPAKGEVVGEHAALSIRGYPSINSNNVHKIHGEYPNATMGMALAAYEDAVPWPFKSPPGQVYDQQTQARHAEDLMNRFWLCDELTTNDGIWLKDQLTRANESAQKRAADTQNGAPAKIAKVGENGDPQLVSMIPDEGPMGALAAAKAKSKNKNNKKKNGAISEAQMSAALDENGEDTSKRCGLESFVPTKAGMRLATYGRPNATAAIYEIHNKHKFSVPEFLFQTLPSGDRRQQIFEATMTMSNRWGAFEAKGAGQNKKAAKEEACKMMLISLPEDALYV